MASNAEDDEVMTLPMLTQQLQQFHSYGGWTFRHRRQPLTRWFATALVVIVLDSMTEIVFDFVLDYDEQLFFAFGNVCPYFFGASYSYFPIVFFYKIIGLVSLITHVTSNYDWIEWVHHQLVGLEDRVAVTRLEMTRVTGRAKLVTFGSVQLWGTCAFFGVLNQTFLVHFGRLPWYLVLPTFVTIHFTIIVYTYLHWCLLGQYYLILAYCIRLVRAGNRNLIKAINEDDGHNNQNNIEQALSDFEVIASCVHRVWQYVSKIYLIHLIATSCMIPMYIFNVAFADISVFIKLVLFGNALYFLSVVGFLSYLPGRVDLQLDPAADRLYRNIIVKNKTQHLSKLRYKYLKFELHSMHGLGLSIAGYRINLSTCISLATIYVTVFSLLIHSRNSVDQIEFV